MMEKFEELGGGKLSEVPPEDFTLFLGEQRLQVLHDQFERKREPVVQLLAERFARERAFVAKGYLPPAQLANISFSLKWNDMTITSAEGIVEEWENANPNNGLCASCLFYRHDAGVREAYVAAKVFTIARDDSLNAAMLWKLSWDGDL